LGRIAGYEEYLKNLKLLGQPMPRTPENVEATYQEQQDNA
jgi:hypothetical protein